MQFHTILQKTCCLSILGIMTFMPFPSFTQNLTFENPIRFLALGDSYTIGQNVPPAQRWSNQLSDSLQLRGFEIDTLTIIATTGWRTDNLINAISNKDLENRNYNLVSLLIGVNNQFQSRPFSQYVTELPALMDSAVRYADGNRDHVFIVSIPDYAYTPFGQQSSDPEEISTEINQYNNYNKQLADSMGITYFDITPISRLGLINPSYVASDGLHPSGIQYTEWVKLMLELIDEHLTESFHPEALPPLEVNLSPNPASDLVRIELKNANSHVDADLKIFDITGIIVMEKRINQNETIISLHDLKEGFYFVRITSGPQHILKKLIIKIF